MQHLLPGQQRVHGHLRLEFVYDQERHRTCFIAHEQNPPLQVVRAFPIEDGGTLVHLHNISGGVLGGDQYTIIVDAGERARVQLTSTSATRLYRCRENVAAAQQMISIRVQRDGLLEYLPDPLIPFAGSRYQQSTQIELEQGAGLFWWEVVTPGRRARGEVFAYDLLQIGLTLGALGQPIAIERMKLEPQCRPLASGARLGGYHYFSSFYICRVGLSTTQWLELENSLNDLARRLTQPESIIWGVSALVAHGLVIRAVSQYERGIASGHLAFWQAAKRALYAEEAILPRKIY